MKWWLLRRRRDDADTSEADEALREVLENRPRVEEVTRRLHRELRQNHFSQRLNDIFKS